MKRTWLEKILIWILAVTMLVTNIDVTAFTSAAEELIIEEDDGAEVRPQEDVEYAVPETEPVFEITDVETIGGSGQQPQDAPTGEDVQQPLDTPPEEDVQQPLDTPTGEDAPQTEEIPSEDAVQVPETEPESEAPSEDVLQDGSAVPDGQDDVIVESIDEIEPEEGLPVDEEQIEEELAAMAANNIQLFHTRPVWYGLMEYHLDDAQKGPKYNIEVTYSYNGTNHTDSRYVWIYGEGPEGEKRIAYCIEPGVSSLDGSAYSKKPNSLMEHPDFKDEPEKARRIMEYAFFGIEYPDDPIEGHWGTNKIGVEYFAAAQELIWEEIGVTDISWHLQNTDKTIDTKVDERKARIKTLIAEYRAEPEFESAPLYQDKTKPDKIYTMKLKSNSVDLKSWNINMNKLPKGVKNVVKNDRDIQFKLDPNVTVTTVTFEFTKTVENRFGMFYYTSSGQQTVIIAGALPDLSCKRSETVVPVSRVRIRKTNDAGSPVRGVTFSYGTSKTKLDKTTKPTDEDGWTEVTIDLPGVNTIYVQEKEVPSYLVKSDEIKAVTFKTGGIGEVTFVNDRVRHSVSIKKINSLTGEPLAGAVFRYWETGKLWTMDMAVTDENGSFTSGAKFLPGAFVTMEEVSAPSGYKTPKPPHNRQEIRVDMDESKNVFEFSNTPKYARLRIEKYNERTGDPVRDGVGCKFRVSTKLSDMIKEPYGGTIVELGSDGFADLGTYAHGTTVFFQEIEAPPGYELNKRLRWARIDATETTDYKEAVNTVRVPNTQITVQLRLKKKGSDGRPLEGVRFRLEQRIDQGKWFMVATNLVTGSDGTVAIPGTYDIDLLIEERLRLIEEETVPGYQLFKDPIIIGKEYAQETSPIIEIEQTNERIPTRFTVYKYDEESPDKKPLAGAVFEITDEDGDLVQTITTNSAGYAETTELLTDVTYYIEEIEAPRGYQKAEGRKSFVISSEGEENSSGEYFLQREYPNKPYKGRIKVKKTNQDGIALAGIEFTIYKGTKAVQRLKTNEEGYAESDWLNADSEYRIRETYTPPQFDKTDLLDYTFDFLKTESGQLNANWRVDVERNESVRQITASFTVKNEELLGNVTIRKVDAERPEVTVAGATFELYNRYDKKNRLGTATTDEGGIAEFKNLPIVNPLVDSRQGHYYLVETTPGENHILPEETELYFSLTADRLDYEIEVKNPPVKGSVELLKVDEDNPDKKLEGAEFAIYEKGDLNNAVQTKTTDENGWLRFADLRYGEYVIKEMTAPENYHNEMIGYPVTIKDHKQVVKLTVTNPKKKMQVKVLKTNEKNDLPIGFVRFHIMSGSGELLETITTNADGIALSQPIELDRLGKNPYVVEAETVPGYEPNTKHYPIRVEADSTQEIQIAEIGIGNVPKESDFKLRKVNEEGEPVKACFRFLVSWKTSTGASGTTDSSVWTDPVTGIGDFNEVLEDVFKRYPELSQNKVITFGVFESSTEPQYQKLPGQLAEITLEVKAGALNYKKVEINASSGVTYDKDTLTLTIVNKKLKIGMNLVKYDFDDVNKYLAGAVFRVTPLDENKKPIGEPFEVTTTDSKEGVEIDLPYAAYYQFDELQAPPGYHMIGNATYIYSLEGFKEIKDGNIIIGYENKQWISNRKSPQIAIRKVGEKGEPLDATFKCTDWGSGQNVTAKTQASNGGYAYIDFSDFSTPYPARDAVFVIYEISVDDPNYEIIKKGINLEYKIVDGKFTFIIPDSLPEGISVQLDAPDRVTISVVNKRIPSTFQLDINKVDEKQNIAEAVFEIREENYLNRTWEVRTENGKANLDTIVKELLKAESVPNEVTLGVYETSTQDGLQLYQDKLADLIVNKENIKYDRSDKFRLENRAEIVQNMTQEGNLFSFTVENKTLDITLNLIKKDADQQNTYLAGAVFEVTPEGFDPIRVETTNSPDGVRVEDLPRADTYAVQEIKAPEGYILDPTVYTYTLDEFTNEYGTDGKTLVAKRHIVTHTNEPITGNLRIRKVDAQNGASLSGAVFELRKGAPPEDYDEAGTDVYEKVGTITIGPDGTGGYNNLPYGAYFLREITAPDGYQLSKELIPFAIEQVMQTVELDVPNRRLEGSLTILKVDSENNQKPLAGAVFTIHRQGTDEQVGDELVTNEAGQIGPVSLPYDKYYIKEVRFPAGYVSATGKTYPFELKQTHTVHSETIENTKAQYGLRIYKRDGETRKMLAGAVFGVFTDGETPQANKPIVTFRSNASGIATALLSEPNDYDVYELVPPAGYQPMTEKIDVYVNNTTPTIELDIDNYRQMLTIEIHKREEGTDEPLAGAVFEIRNERTGALVATTDPTGANGRVTVKAPAGDHTYTVTEIKAPDGYVLDSTPYPVTVKKGEDGDGNITYEAEPLVIGNKLIQGNIRLLKVDATDKKTPLAGAVFEVRNADGETVDELTTNSQGEAMSKELQYGKYTLVETKAPEGYELDSTTQHSVELSKDHTLVTVTAENTPKKGGFTVKKVDAEDKEKTLAGAEFTIYKSYEDAQNPQNEVDKQTTGTDGLASFKDLDYGTYYVRETKAPDGYRLNDRIMAVTVDQDWQSAPPLVAVDYEQPEKGYFRVVKTDKETGIGLAGAQFTVTGPDNYEKVYTTDERGMFQTELLTPGTYTVTETKAPEGYYLSEEPERTKTVEVVAGAGTLVAMQELIFENEQILVPIRIKKTDDAKEPKPLVGAEFKIYRLDENGERIEPEIETLVTNMHGEAVSKQLPAGSYEVVETAAPKGYELAADPSQTVTIDAASTGETLTFAFVNTVKRGDLKVKKVDADDPEKVLSGAVFEAYGIESGVSYKETSGEDGYAVFNDLPYGNYRVREIEAPEGYERNDTFEEYVTVGEDSSDGGTSIEIVAPNTPLKGVIQLTKRDALTGEAIDGAVYGIYKGLLTDGDVDPATYMGEAYDLVSKSPNVTSKELAYGTYYVKEKTPPKGYKVNDEVYTVEFRDNIPLIAIDAEDEPYRGSVSVEKRDGKTKKPLAGVVFAIFTAEEYEKYLEAGNSAHDLSPIYLVTDEDGKASSGEALTPGQEYVMAEYAPPAGYDPPTKEDGSEAVWEFTPTLENLTFRYEIDNTKRSEIVIHKKDENGSPVNGVVFGLYSYGADGKAETGDDTEIAQFGTAIDGSGIARFDTKNLANGWYYVKELSCGSLSYEISKEIVPIEITDDKREYEFDFINYRPRAEVAIQKRDEYGRPLAGARFGLYKYTPDWQEKTDFENDLIEEFKLDEKGYGKLENLICDLYVLREIEAPAGYRRMEPALVDLLDMADKIDPPDYPDAETPETKAGQTDEPRTEADETGNTGREGFGQTDSRKRDDQIHVSKGEKNGRTYYYYHHDLYNEPLTGWIEIQKEGAFDGGSLASGMDLSGARFELRDGSDKLVDTVTTDRDGRGRSRELPLGTYTITETAAPDGTQLNAQTGTVVIDGTGANDVYTYTHTNTVVMGQIRIKKTDPKGTLLQGAEFDIYAEDAAQGESGEPVDHLITGEGGTATSKALPYGWYIIRETKSPDGYTFDPNLRLRRRISEADQTIELTVLNYPGDEPGVYVVKYDKDDPNHYLANAQFALSKDEDLTEQIGTYTTDENGQLQITDTQSLTQGTTYYLKETAAPSGYQLDETVHSFVWGETTTIALYIPNEKEKGYIRFEKTGEMLSEIKEDLSYPNLKELVWEQKQLENAQIGIYATEEVALNGKKYQKGDLILRLSSGQTSAALPTGTYEYQELSAPPSYILDTRRYPIEVTKETTELKPALVTMENTHAGVRLELYKEFSDNQNTEENFAQVRFGVYTAAAIAGGEVQIEPETLVGVFGVDKNGFAEPELKLPEGLYYVKELETAEGYVLDDTRYPFRAVYNNENETIVISTKEEPIVNEPLYGVIRLEKKGELFTQVETSIEENKYQVNRPVFTQGELYGAKVEIRTTEAATIDGTAYEKGAVVDTLISGEKPESRRLPFGTYEAVEVEAPEGYVLDGTPREVTIAPMPDQSPVHTVELLSLANAKKKVDLKLYKSFFGTAEAEAKKLYEKVLFGVYAAEDIRGAADGAILRKDTLVALIRMREDGSGGIEKGMLPSGGYYVKELETAEGYQLDETEYPFTVSFAQNDPSDGNTVQAADTITVEVAGIDKEHPVMNLPDGTLTPFAFRKVDEEGDPLAGAVFRLYYCRNEEADHTHSELAGEDGSCWTEIAGLSPRTSGADGVVDFGLLPDGTYQLRETEAPNGYVLPAGQWRITVDSLSPAAEHITITAAGDVQPPAFERADGGDVYQYQVSNRKVRDLPFTGGAGILGYIGGGSALLAASGFLRKRKKKNKKHSNQ